MALHEHARVCLCTVGPTDTSASCHCPGCVPIEYWTPSDSGIGDLYNLTEVMNVPSVVHTPIIHARAPHTAIVDAVAGYLIGAGGASHSYLMCLLRNAVIF